MSFGWSAGDIVSFARLCYEIYSFCDRAPAELQDLSDRLDSLGRKLERLSYILEASGLERWKAASTLEKDLGDVKSYLEPLRSDTNNAVSVSSRARGLGKYALNQERLRGMERNLVQREREIDDMKIDIILVCSLRNLRHGQDGVQNASQATSTLRDASKGTGRIEALPGLAMLPSSVESEGGVVFPSRSISNASRVLEAAVDIRSRRSAALEARDHDEGLSDDSVYSLQMAQDLVAEISSLAEQQELYSGNVDHSKKLKVLTGIADTAAQFSLAKLPSRRASSGSSAYYQLPQVRDLAPSSFEQAMFDQLSSTSDSASLRLWASSQHQKAASESSQGSAVDNLNPPRHASEPTQPGRAEVPGYSQVEDEILPVVGIASMPAPTSSRDSITSQGGRLKLQGWSRVSMDAASRTAMACSYKLETSPGSLVVVCIPAERTHNSREVITVSSTPPAVLRSSTTRLHRIVRHCLQPESRPVPHLLHPDVEGPTIEPNAPYTLSFTEPQWVSTEGSSKGLRQTNSFRYIFEKQADRTNLCEMMFGKALVMTVGSERIFLDDREISHVSAVSLWFDVSHESLSITFLKNLGIKGSAPKDEEWKIYGICGKGKTTRSQASLSVFVGPMSGASERVGSSNIVTRPPSSGSRSPTLTRILFASSARSHSPTPSRCTIVFSHPSDRAVFVEHLPP